MKKSTSLKISVFSLLSAIICSIGNHLLDMEILTAIIHGLTFFAYLFLTISISQLIYEKVKFGINLIVLFMSFAMALYSITMFSVSPFEVLMEYYVLFFYWFVLLCLASAIVLVGRIIFYSPKAEKSDKKHEETEEETAKIEHPTQSGIYTIPSESYDNNTESITNPSDNNTNID